MCRFSLIDVTNFVRFEFREKLRQQTHCLVLSRFRQQFKRFSNRRASPFSIFRHLVKSFAIIVILHQAKRFHRTVQIVVNNGIAILTIVKRLPPLSRELERLRIVANRLRHLQLFRTSLRRHRVEIPTNDEINVVSHNSCEIVVYRFRSKFQFIKFLKAENHICIPGGKRCTRVRRIVYRSCCRHRKRAVEAMFALVILLHGEIERTTNAFCTTKLQVRPLSLVEKIGESMLQIVENSRVRSLNLACVECHTRIKFLRPHRGGYERSATNEKN